MYFESFSILSFSLLIFFYCIFLYLSFCLNLVFPPNFLLIPFLLSVSLFFILRVFFPVFFLSFVLPFISSTYLSLSYLICSRFLCAVILLRLLFIVHPFLITLLFFSLVLCLSISSPFHFFPHFCNPCIVFSSNFPPFKPLIYFFSLTFFFCISFPGVYSFLFLLLLTIFLFLLTPLFLSVVISLSFKLSIHFIFHSIFLSYSTLTRKTYLFYSLSPGSISPNLHLLLLLRQRITLGDGDSCVTAAVVAAGPGVARGLKSTAGRNERLAKTPAHLSLLRSRLGVWEPMGTFCQGGEGGGKCRGGSIGVDAGVTIGGVELGEERRERGGMF